MVDYDSDSSLSDAGDDVSTNVLLGYASKEPTEDTFSQLGGLPSFFPDSHPRPSLVTCRCCDDYMSLLLQLNGDLPSRFTGHERRLYLWACRKKQCRRKDGSVRSIRGVRIVKDKSKESGRVSSAQARMLQQEPAQPKEDIGSTLFGAKPSSLQTNGNPFSLGSSSSPSTSNFNPFSSAPGPLSSLAAKPPQPPSTANGADSDLPATFAEKARISTPPTAASQPQEPWPPTKSFSQPYPTYHLDAETEYLSSSSAPSDPNTAPAAFMDTDTTPSSSAEGAEAESEMTLDKTFQHFADRVAQNPEQVLRYEFAGEPLLYSRSDSVGKALAGHHDPGAGKVTTTGSAKGMPRCQRCGAKRVFECQLMPQTIVELEEGEEAAVLLSEGMEWGTIILGVCERDCGEEGGIRYVEEWVGVQWEEVVQRKR